MERKELDFNLLKRRILGSIGALLGRTALVQAVGLVAFGVLTVYLEPQEIGVFIVVSALMRFFWLFSDLGLGASLIQKKEVLKEEELKTVFTLQVVIVGFLSLLGFTSRELVASIAGFGEQGVFLYTSLLVAFFLSSFKTVPSVLLEREVRFHKLVVPQIGEQLFFHLTVAILAVAGFGVDSYSFAVLVSALAGLPIYYLVSPWRPGVYFSRQVASDLLSFGVFFQGKTVLAAVKDDLLMFFIRAAGFLTFVEFGFIGWAQRWAFAPFRFAVESVTKVAFPAFSRVQKEKEVLRSGLEKSLFFVSFFILPILVGLVFGIFKTVDFFPQYEKWRPALVSLCFFAGNAAISSWSGILVNVLDATGRVKTTLGLMSLWTLLVWFLTISFINYFGFNGFAAASFLVTLSIVLTIYLVKQSVEFSFLKSVFRPVVGVAGMALTLLFLKEWADSFGKLFVLELLSGAVYLAIVGVLYGRGIIYTLLLYRKLLVGFFNKRREA